MVTCDIHETPDAVLVSRLFSVPKNKSDVCPIIDLGLIFLGVQLELASLALSLPLEKFVKLRSLGNAT